MGMSWSCSARTQRCAHAETESTHTDPHSSGPDHHMPPSQGHPLCAAVLSKAPRSVGWEHSEAAELFF